MQLSNPVLICDEHDDFRILIRDILTKNGFFHILEASNQKEALIHLKKFDDLLVLMDSHFFSTEFMSEVQRQKDFLIFIDDEAKQTPDLVLKVGLEKVLSHPISSRKLMNKILSDHH